MMLLHLSKLSDLSVIVHETKNDRWVVNFYKKMWYGTKLS